jgi:serine/threonine-protein kinase
MEEELQKGAWPAATAALERARGRLGDRDSAGLQRLEQGRRELELADRLAQVRLDRALSFYTSESAMQYGKAFAEAGLGKIADEPEVVARRIGQSNIRQALVDALDDWAFCYHNFPDERYEAWLLDVARKVDPDPTWRDRLRDPSVRRNRAKLLALAESARVDSTPVNLLVTLGELLRTQGADAIPYLVKVQHQHPRDLFVNYLLGTLARNPTEGIRYFQVTLTIRPDSPILCHNLARHLLLDNRTEEALSYFQEAVRRDPQQAVFRSGLAACLTIAGRERESAEQVEKGLALNPDTQTKRNLLLVLRSVRLAQRRWEEAAAAWAGALQTEPPEHTHWYGYAELCLFCGQEKAYRDVRRAMLQRFGAATDPIIAERTGRACLLLPAEGDELRQAVALARRATAADPSRYGSLLHHFQVVGGLAEYRQGRYEPAIATLRGNALGGLGPAARLVLAMALHQNGQKAEARKVLTAGVVGYDWSAGNVRDQDEWIFHVLRREAERMILPELPAFLEGKYQPKDNDERLALTGVCQSQGRHRTAARLYADAFAADPRLAEDLGKRHRYFAARAAAQAGCGLCMDSAGVEDAERARWRTQAREWLRADLTVITRWLDGDPAARGQSVRTVFVMWGKDPELACVRDPGALDRLAADEAKQYRALWADVAAVIARTGKS